MEKRIVQLADQIFEQISGPWNDQREIEILIGLHSISLHKTRPTAQTIMDEIEELSNDRHEAEHPRHNEVALDLVDLKAKSLVNSLFYSNNVNIIWT